MKKMLLILYIVLMVISPGYGQESHALFTEILQDYVLNGKVNYELLCRDERLQVYTEQLSQTNPDTISDQRASFAFWLNAYNAFTLKIICDNYPIKSINELHWGGLYIGTLLKKTVWDKEFITINGKELSLNYIEHTIVRAKFKDPRTHFALVCASISCPPLRNEAYQAHKLDEQLDEQGRSFFSEPNKNHFKLEGKKACLSKILDWFEDDFGENDEEILLYVAQFLPEKLAAAIKSEPDQWKIKYTNYDWGLNE